MLKRVTGAEAGAGSGGNMNMTAFGGEEGVNKCAAKPEKGEKRVLVTDTYAFNEAFT